MIMKDDGKDDKRRAIQMKDAIQLLESGEPCDLRVWKLSTGDIIDYKGVRCQGAHWRGGCHRVRLKNGYWREFRDITLFEINGMSVYL